MDCRSYRHERFSTIPRPLAIVARCGGGIFVAFSYWPTSLAESRSQLPYKALPALRRESL